MKKSSLAVVFRRVIVLAIATIIVCQSGQAQGGRYLMIYHSDLAGSAMDDLIALQTSRGFEVVADSVGNWVSRDSIKTIIANTYHQHGLRFVLLIGAARRTGNSVEEYTSPAWFHGNLIPTYYDWFLDYRTAFDHYYTVVDTANYGYWYRYSWPNIVLGRLPVRDTVDLRHYVDKLEFYYADTAAADWKNDILLVQGDMDRGGLEMGVPPVGQIIQEISAVSGRIKSGYDKTTIKYSDYSFIGDRQDAMTDELDSGKLLVYMLSTGSNGANFANFLIRSNESWLFDAYVDLDPTFRYPIIVGGSCNIGQADTTYSDTTLGEYRLLAENLLFAPDRGAIVLIGPSGFSLQDDDSDFMLRFNDRFNKYPFLPIGEIFTFAKYFNPYRTNSNETLMMYTLYGDPSLVAQNPNAVDEPILYMDFEFGTRVPFEDSVVLASNQISADTAGVFTLGGEYGRDRVYRVKGTDGYAISGSAKSRWILYDNLNIVLNYPKSYLRFLHYHIASWTHPEDTGRCGVQAVLKDGSTLSLHGIVDQYGDSIGAVSRKNELHWGGWYVFDLAGLGIDTLDKIVLEYDAVDATSQGDFEFVVYTIGISSTWGRSPIVGEIQAPSSVTVGDTAIVFVNAEDPDYILGDSLSFDWSAAAGSISGSGSSVTYHAPATQQQDTIYVSVIDRGNNPGIFISAVVSVIADGGGGCPFVYVRSEDGYVLDNVVLTESESLTELHRVTDHYVLTVAPDVKAENVSVRIAEEEREESFLYRVALVAYDVSSLTEDEKLALNSGGELVAAGDPMIPLYAIDKNGFDVLELISAEDGRKFFSYTEGSLQVAFDLRSLLSTSLSPSVPRGEVQGGGVADTPPKGEVNKISLSSTDETGNMLTMSTVDSQGHSVKMGTVYPRINKSVHNLVDFAPFITESNIRWFVCKLEWTKGFSTDEFAFYTYRTLPKIGELDLVSAYDDRMTDVSELIGEPDNQCYHLTPGRYIDLSFARDRSKDPANVRYVIEIEGYYCPYDKDFLNADEDDPIILDLSNHPNPFNAETEISFEVTRSVEAKVDIYNVLGQKVRNLLDGRVNRGKTVLKWDGTNADNQPVATGVYYYVIKAGDESRSRKLLLLK